MSLLEKTQAMIEMERSLTLTLEKVEPWLTSNTVSRQYAASRQTGTTPRVRPIPTTMEQVHQVLAVARNYSTRTSAPAGWNTNAPVIGFSTPNPLPHQLRGGVLAALELERARQAERDKKRKRQEEEEEEERAKKASADVQAMDIDESIKKDKSALERAAADTSGRPKHDPKAAEAAIHRQPAAVGRPSTTDRRPVVATTMNLSDSSSSDDEDDDDD